MKFTVIVPAEHRDKLLEVLARLGLVHLSPKITEISLPASQLSPTKLETLEQLRGGINSIKASLKKLESAVTGLVVLRLAEEFVEKKDFSILRRAGLPKEAISSIKAVVDRFEPFKKASPSEELKSVIDSIAKTYIIKEILAQAEKHKLLASGLSMTEYSVDEIRSKINSITRSAVEYGHELNKTYAALNDLSDVIVKELKEPLRTVVRVVAFESSLEALTEAQENIKEFDLLHGFKVSIAEGWAPSIIVSKFKAMLKNELPSVIYFSFRKARPGERVPRLMKRKGLMGYLSKITLMRGVPSYWEIDPTPIFTLLFTAMYGMMFGDLGLGVIIALFGLFLRKAKEGFLGMSEAGINALSVLSILCGISATIFGALYGVAFLVPVWEPILLSPLHDLFEMIAIALIFGAIQLLLSMALNIVNRIRMKEYFEAIFGARGLAGITFYIGGAYLAYHIVLSGFNLGVATSSQLLPVTITVLSMMALVPASSIIKGLITKHSEAVTHGVIELIELIVEYPANSLSYIRLAAFALAHEAFGILAKALGEFIGLTPSLLFANLLVLMIEGFAVGIQALRLTYYEFSTKFFKGGGIIFKPITTAAETE